MSTVPALVAVASPLPVMTSLALATTRTLRRMREDTHNHSRALEVSHTLPPSTASETTPALQPGRPSHQFCSYFVSQPSPSTLPVLTLPMIALPLHDDNLYRSDLNGLRPPTSLPVAQLLSASVSGANTTPNMLRVSTHLLSTLLSSCFPAAFSAYPPALLLHSYFTPC